MKTLTTLVTAVAVCLAIQPAASAANAAAGTDPTIGVAWRGVDDSKSAAQTIPPSANGAIGLRSFVEIAQSRIGIYTRTGGTIATGSLGTLVGSDHFLLNPMILWDSNTGRFFYSMSDLTDGTIRFGFSKSGDPRNVGSAWCRYVGRFGYDPETQVAEFPRLGQTKNFLLVGIHLVTFGGTGSTSQSDLLWIEKPAGSGAISSCPAGSSLAKGRFPDLRNVDDTQAFVPVPAIQADPSGVGYVVAAADLGDVSTGDFITIFDVRRPSGSDTPVLSAPRQISVPEYAPPPDAPQKDSTDLLNTGLGSFMNAISAVDPRTGKVEVWTSHTVAGGAGSEVRWYEINPGATPSLFQSGAATHSRLFAFNGAISPDRTVRPAGAAHGSNMVLGFNTSSADSFPAIRMLSKVGGNPQSRFVLVKSSAGASDDFSCDLGDVCFWGNYAGATPDPAAPLTGGKGSVWLTNEWNVVDPEASYVARTWNWQAMP